MIKFAINGFGRIGKNIIRAYAEGNYPSIECSVINAGFGDLESTLHLLKYDSIHGIFDKVEIIDNTSALINGRPIKFIFEPDIEKINWKSYGAEIVLECTGKYTQKDLALKHIKAGAGKVIVSAPCENADATIVYGVNEALLTSSMQVISLGSCTTNCLAPVAQVINDGIGIESGFMTTIHSYTNDQNLLDGVHKDLRRARAAALSMIPSSTGAAKALGLVIPELMGKLDGIAVRVPTPNVSMIDLTFYANRETTIEEINRLFKNSKISSKVLAYTEEPLVSIDFTHNSASSIFDSTQTRVVKGKFCRVVAWYDNEWGFSNRMLDTTVLLQGLKS